ncbi:Rossmann-like and DUF2520 domain-containing protein [Allomuricauda sp. CP2A]|jgi:predicted short-subunit dehydrogenase-like oxidoreductase (DUF2520 family)|uniref:Rossmann-like and DUF2520 domain-containing protein n=1 Tax=Allomuricauda sp. CP2A TaxID=1848189 RepID=UPI000829E07E|nr:Rossmann-like and DUF2520 domain-containing protein [Muricauda sp. CP2A]
MLSIVILGTGNIAKHLAGALSKAEAVTLAQVVGRNQEQLHWFSSLAPTTNDFNAIVDADVYLIAVKDDAIVEVSEYLSDKKGIVAHTSGATEMDSLPMENRGVFYPLQSFTEGRPLDFKSIPFCIEAHWEGSAKTLKLLARHLSDSVYDIDSHQRKKLHLAAMFVNNFSNYLYGVGEKICVEEGLTFDLLKPLILETAEKVQTISPKEAQTGPARRGDEKTMQAHLALLEDEKHIELYKLFSEAIKKVYEEKL